MAPLATVRLAFLLFFAVICVASGFAFNGYASAIGKSGAFTATHHNTQRVGGDGSSLPSHEEASSFDHTHGDGSLYGGKTLSAKQVLSPELYFGPGAPLPPSESDAQGETVPFSCGLQLLVRSIESILAVDTSSGDASILDHLDGTSILRIEQKISAVHSVDPLCWLHAQQRAVDNLRRKLQSSPGPTNGDETLPVIYFGDAEGHVEAAALGKASPAYSDTWDPFSGKRIWDDINGNTVNGDAERTPHHMFKESELPMGARVYGGSRFDWEHYHRKMQKDPYSNEGSGSDDWDGFGGDGGGFWILPAVELRRETVAIGDSAAGTKSVTLAVHLHNLSPPSFAGHGEGRQEHHRQGWKSAASHVMSILRELSDQLSPAVPCTTLPPVLTRKESSGKGEGGEDLGLSFERGVTEALNQIQSNKDSSPNDLRKVVLARKVDLNLGASVRGLDVLMRMKFGGHIGHLFYMNPGERESGMPRNREFLGCTPERLFRVNGFGHDRMVTSEALAGTRIRGLTPSADNELLRELLSSKKDMLENEITGQFIREALLELEENGWLEKNKDDLLASYDMKGNENQNAHQERYFVRRLRHLQHICQTFEGRLSQSAKVIDISRSLLRGLHPTPAVCGDSPIKALEFIRQYETLGFDRGFYAGPFGYMGRDSADVVVAIRSALVTNYGGRQSTVASSSLLQQSESDRRDDEPGSKVSVFGGAGIVDGSTVQGEWIETSHKLGVLSSLFPSSPITLQSYSTPNVAWATAFIEELVRCGVTQFYICPGSRNTPLTAAIFKATRSNVGVVRAISVHDERGAGFRAIGYARQNGRPAAVVTSSGTAVANLYPSVVEASSDGVPLLLLTADRPYENRDNGSNQSIDQVKIFSSSYVRWFRDILPPSDDVPVSLALSDANHAVALTKQLMGPVHLNVQLRENLAPDAGPIRNDNRVGSTTAFQNARFTDVPGFARWSRGGNRWQDAFYPSHNDDPSIMEIAELIRTSRRGIIVTGNLRGAQADGDGTELLSGTIAHFAQLIGFPIFAGVQSGALRREYPVVLYAEHLLKNPLVSKGMQPDLILQLGTPLISTEVSQVIKSNPSAKHVVLQKFHPNERADPDFTVTHRISADIGSFLKSVTSHLEGDSLGTLYGSELAPLLYLGRELQKQMQSIVQEASNSLASESSVGASSPTINGEASSSEAGILTEPQVMAAISEVLGESSLGSSPMSMFLSNSMPVRDGEFFLYPSERGRSGFPSSVSVNRGASGIDGIISTATGCGDTAKPTTLVCGDVTTLHDLNALYGLTQDDTSSSDTQPIPNVNKPPLTAVIVNNGGGAIFSFLPIAKHGQDVGFEEYWGTPTRNFSFEKGASAFGLPYLSASSFESFKEAYRSSIESGRPSVIEAKVAGRSSNVNIHQQITREATLVVGKVLGPPPTRDFKLPVKQYVKEDTSKRAKTLLLLHGWMGDKSEWDMVGETLSGELSEEWNIISIDLPGHGDSPMILSSDQQVAHSSLGLDAMRPFGPAQNSPFSLENMARAVCQSLIQDHGVEHLDAIAGYSLGGRIALAMRRLYSTTLSSMKDGAERASPALVSDQTRMILLGSNPGRLPSDVSGSKSANEDAQRLAKDASLAESLFSSGHRSYLVQDSQDEENLTRFLTKWYGVASLWGDLRQRHPAKYQDMLSRRLQSLAARRQDIASVLYGCSPSLAAQDDWKAAVPSRTLFVAGGLDKKYSRIGHSWREMQGIARYVEISNAGHALLVEEPEKVSTIISGFVTGEVVEEDGAEMDAIQRSRQESPKLQTKSVLTVEGDAAAPAQLHRVGILEYESFSITIGADDESEKGVQGIGWGDSARPGSEVKKREGFIISVASRDGMAVGVGEVSPLKGLHTESLEESERQLQLIKDALSSIDVERLPEFDASQVLSLDGSLTKCIDSIFDMASIEKAPSVSSGLEMAILSLSAQLYGMPLPQALAANGWEANTLPRSSFSQLPINGLVTRGEKSAKLGGKISFPSVKVKVGHRDSAEDALHLIQVKQSLNLRNLKLRADANRAWDVESAQGFVDEFKRADESALSSIEFIEEPIEQQIIDGEWSIDAQVTALEAFASKGGLKYALDESLADLAVARGADFDAIAADLRAAFGERAGQRSCAAFVLKPALLGLELSMQLAKLAQEEFQISPVFSSSFDSGIGLAYTAILAAVADNAPYSTNVARFAHGLGTFDMLRGDTLSPPFESYVNKDGLLNVRSLSRALYGLSLDEMSDRLPTYESASTGEPAVMSTESDSFLATTASTSGRDITVSVSLPLPFSDGVASSRFTDLPQMSRWSPWLNSVTYLDESPGLTEWNLNIRGVKFSWKAKSQVLAEPKGIAWESTSGLKNRGMVEFEPTSDDSCMMKLKMSIIMPYILVSLFNGIPMVQEFLQNKLLKWSLEMFRDVVKADLALERGDQELGDALFGAVEGRANALEEALK
ncbi:hypothetical protein ACHAXT_003579 [Thalassiosira profunda]